MTDTAYAVLRIESVKRKDLAGMGHHHTRTHADTDEHIDTTRSHLNRVLIGSGDPAADIQRLATQYKQARAAKDPADDTIATEMILTAAAAYFDRDFAGWQTDTDTLQPWIDAQIDFLREHEQQIGITASATLHVDELAPHLHVALVPITDVRIKNRFSDRTEKRISHSALFSDDKATIAQARQRGTTATDTKLGRLQTAYATDLQRHGLDIERGIPKSHRRHVPPKEWRDIIAQDTPTPTPPSIKKPRAVEHIKDAIDVMTRGKKAQILTQYDTAITAFIDTTSAGLTAIKAKDAQINALKTQTNELQKENAMLKKELRTLTDAQREMAQELAKDKALLQEYRQITQYELIQKKAADWPDIDAFTAQSGRAKFNAIDFIRYREQCDFQTAVLTLAESFSSDRIAAQIAGDKARELVPVAFQKADTEAAAAKATLDKLDEEPTKKIKPRPQTKSDTVKARAIQQQTDAMGAEQYRITLMHNSPDQPTINLGKPRSADEQERFYTAQDLIDLIPTLAYRNAHGYNVFITPMPSERTRFILLDDIRDIERAREYNPALILHSSPNSQQALYKVSGELPEQESRLFFNNLNREIGDPNITGLIHPLRLAGFTNRKPKHAKNGQFPFITIDYAADVRSDKAEAEIRALQETKAIERHTIKTYAMRRIAHVDTHEAADWYKEQVEKWGEKTDYSKIDRELAEALAAAGFSEYETKAALLQTSPRITERHPDLERYLTSKTAGLEFAEEKSVHTETRSRMKL